MAKKEYLTEGEGYVDIELSRPLMVHGASVSTLRMREPTVQDQLVIDSVSGGSATQELTLMSNLCEVAKDDLMKLPLRDYKRVQTAFLGFID